MTAKNIARLVISLAFAYIAAAIGSVFTMPAIAAWYATINKPFFNPPNWIFAPVWTLLFTLMGIALFLIWKDGIKENPRKTAFWVFLAHLVVNILWSYVFFGLRNFSGGFLVIIVLWLMILYLTIKFWSIKKSAGILLLPYLFWVSFASILNYAIWMLN